MVQGLDQVDQLLTLTMAAYDLRRHAAPGEIAPAERVMSSGKVEMTAFRHSNEAEMGLHRPLQRNLRAV